MIKLKKKKNPPVRDNKKVNNKHNSKHLYNNKSSITAETGLIVILSNKKKFNVLTVKRFGTDFVLF